MLCNQLGPSFEFMVNALVAFGRSDACQRCAFAKTAYRERVRRVLKSQKARTVAKNCTLGLRKVCKQVVQSGGIATRG